MTTWAAVTGAGSGIGRAVAIACAAAQPVLLVGRTPAKLERVADEIAQGGGSARILSCDLRVPDELQKKLAAAADDGVGPFDLLVNAAGIYREGPLADTEFNEIRELIESNLTATITTTKIFLPVIRSGGSVINISSMSASRPLPQQAVYAATKAAVSVFTAALAGELAVRGIRVTAVSPGPTQTPILHTIMPADRIPGVQAELARRMPLKRLVRPEEIAEAVMFLHRTPAAIGTEVLLDGGINAI